MLNKLIKECDKRWSENVKRFNKSKNSTERGGIAIENNCLLTKIALLRTLQKEIREWIETNTFELLEGTDEISNHVIDPFDLKEALGLNNE